jgi:hypothetical protein
MLHGGFAVINSDDYYGKDSYRQAIRFLDSLEEDSEGTYGLIGFQLGNTLSEYGGVTRGLCQTENGWLTARFVFLYPGSRMGALIMEGITTETADYIEWNLRYVCQEQFEEFCRWNDFLGLAFEYENTTAIRNFVPSMMNETKDERIITSSCLELVDRYSLLFPGVGNFRREDGKLYWLFHVASETVYERRMIVSFGSEMPALLSRGLQSGLIPAAGIPETFPLFMGENISLECRIEPGKWLISNVSDRRNTVQVFGNYAVFAMDGTEISDKVLLPWQIAILKEC